MFLSRVFLAMLIAALTTTISFAVPAKEVIQQEQTEDTDQTLSLEDEELAD